jgi:hypothetical protein
LLPLIVAAPACSADSFAAVALDERHRRVDTRGYPVNASCRVREPLFGEINSATALKILLRPCYGRPK